MGSTEGNLCPPSPPPQMPEMLLSLLFLLAQQPSSAGHENSTTLGFRVGTGL